MRPSWPVVLCVCVLSLPARAFAWNHTGHMAVAMLAYRQLTRQERGAAQAMLRAHPHYDRYLAAERPREFSEEQWVFLRAATWPDWVRGSRRHTEHDLRPYHHAAWHYINKPYVPRADAGSFTHAELTPPKPNAVTVLDESARIVAGRGLAEEKAIRLCWIIHLVGDLHQPLHCAALVSRRFPPPHGDDGGNRLAIRPHKHPERMHTYWDRLLGTSTQAKAINRLAERIEDSAARDAQLAEQLRSHTTFDSWADEGLQAAIEYAYLDGRLPLVDYHEVERGTIAASEVPTLPAGYAAEIRAVARHQAALAGRRLATLLAELLPR
ncbi:MAG TPA: S1/P1 nuclease [Pirellulales bacterium]|nr:S1/P1 nuclease [Pirellulales bacterium]